MDITKSVGLTLKLTLASIVFLGLWFLFQPFFTPKPKPLLKAGTYLNADVFENFNLTDTNQQRFTLQSLKGHWTLMYFGYSQCPTVCPKSLAFANDLWQKIAAPEKARFIFTSINPQNDSPLVLKKFLHNFNDSFIGVTGQAAEIQKLTKPLGIVAIKRHETAEELLIEHSSSMALINPQGQLTALFSAPFDAETISADLNSIIQ